MSKRSGVVKFFNSEKGYGFIKDDNGGKEVFVHATGLVDEVKENDRVEYNVKDGKKGEMAVDVQLA